MSYVPSDKIKMFPSAYRGTAVNGEVYDPESRLFTEKNSGKPFTALSSYRNGSFVIDYDDNSEKITFVIHGYYFEIEGWDSIASDNTKTYWGHIRLKPKAGTEGGPTGYEAWSLVPLNSNANVLDNGGEFVALEIFDSAIEQTDGSGDDSDYHYYLKLFKDGNVPESSWLKFKSTELEIEGSDKPISTIIHGTENNFEIDNVKDISASNSITSGNKLNVGSSNTFGTGSANSAMIGTGNVISSANGKAFAQGDGNTASGESSQATGHNTKAQGRYSHAEGSGTTAAGEAAHAEGYNTEAAASYSHAEGRNTEATAPYSHAEGNQTSVSGESAHAEGNDTTASDDYAHAEGDSTTASGLCSHSEGNLTKASGNDSHAEGYKTEARGVYSHAEGEGNGSSNGLASGQAAHVEGQFNIASGAASHAEGNSTQSRAPYSHAEGYYTIADGTKPQHVFGKCNLVSSDDTLVEIVGNGSSYLNRSNARTLDWSGNEWLAGTSTAANFIFSNVPSGQNANANQALAASLIHSVTNGKHTLNISNILGDTILPDDITIDTVAWANSVKNVYACSTASSTQIKTISADDIANSGNPSHGLHITVRFQNTNIATDPQLKITSNGTAYPLYLDSNTKVGDAIGTSWKAGSYVELVFISSTLEGSGKWLIVGRQDDAKYLCKENGVRYSVGSNSNTQMNPIYFSAGTPLAATASIGSGKKPIYMDSGTLKASSQTVGSSSKPIYMSSGTLTAASDNIGSASQPIYMNNGVLTACPAINLKTSTVSIWGGSNNYFTISSGKTLSGWSDVGSSESAKGVAILYSNYDGDSTKAVLSLSLHTSKDLPAERWHKLSLTPVLAKFGIASSIVDTSFSSLVVTSKKSTTLEGYTTLFVGNWDSNNLYIGADEKYTDSGWTLQATLYLTNITYNQ